MNTTGFTPYRSGALALAVLLLPSLALAQGPGPRGGMGGGMGMPLAGADPVAVAIDEAEALGLSSEQTQRLRAFHTEAEARTAPARARLQPLMEEMQARREAMREGSAREGARRMGPGARMGGGDEEFRARMQDPEVRAAMETLTSARQEGMSLLQSTLTVEQMRNLQGILRDRAPEGATLGMRGAAPRGRIMAPGAPRGRTQAMAGYRLGFRDGFMARRHRGR